MVYFLLSPCIQVRIVPICNKPLKQILNNQLYTRIYTQKKSNSNQYNCSEDHFKFNSRSDEGCTDSSLNIQGKFKAWLITKTHAVTMILARHIVLIYIYIYIYIMLKYKYSTNLICHCFPLLSALRMPCQSERWKVYFMYKKRRDNKEEREGAKSIS